MEKKDYGAIIKILSEAIGRRMNAQCRKFNLTMQQMKILQFLKRQEKAGQVTSQKDIQDFMRFSHATVVNILHLLQEKGFIEITSGREDRRMRIVTLTGREEAYIGEMERSRARMERQLVKGMTQQDREQARWYLLWMYENVLEWEDDSDEGGNERTEERRRV